jgi:hypothetical protein
MSEPMGGKLSTREEILPEGAGVEMHPTRRSGVDPSAAQ